MWTIFDTNFGSSIQNVVNWAKTSTKIRRFEVCGSIAFPTSNVSSGPRDSHLNKLGQHDSCMLIVLGKKSDIFQENG